MPAQMGYSPKNKKVIWGIIAGIALVIVIAVIIIVVIIAGSGKQTTVKNEQTTIK